MSLVIVFSSMMIQLSLTQRQDFRSSLSEAQALNFRLVPEIANLDHVIASERLSIALFSDLRLETTRLVENC